MSWTKEEFITFCQRCGVNHEEALKEGKIDLRPKIEQNYKQQKGAVIMNWRKKQKDKNRRERAIQDILKIQDPKRKSDKTVALDKEASEQAAGVEMPSVSFRISIVGLRYRPIDPDNFTAGCKGIIDGLVASRIIPDDDWRTVEIRTSQRKVISFSREGTEITVESISP